MPVGWAAGAALVGSAIAADASGDAADTQLQGSREATAAEREMFDISRAQLQPFMQTGYAANDTLSRLLGLAPTAGRTSSIQPAGTIDQGAPGMPNWQQYLIDNPDVAANPVFAKNPALHYERHGRGEGRALPTIQESTAAGGSGANIDPDTGYAQDNTGLPTGYLTQTFGKDQFLANMDPGYAWRLQQGAQGVMNTAAAGSGSLSGPALKALLEYNQGAASQEYSNAFNRFQTQQGNIFQRLTSVAGLGQNAAAGVGNQAVATGANIGANIVGGANAAAAGQIGQANAWGSALSDLSAIGMYQYMNKQP